MATKSKQVISTKRLQIDKARANLVIFLAVAAFITVFSLMSARALWIKRGFERRVVAEKESTLKTLKDNNTAATELVTAYKAFNNTPDNLIGGSTTGKGDRDGDNAKLVLDALPGQYDFPGLASSIEKLVESDKIGSLESITGTDDEVAQSQSTSTTPVEMPFEVSIKTSATGFNTVLDRFSQSIRPMVLTKVSIGVGGTNEIKLGVSGKSYYLPKKTLDITTKEVR
ncbi:hypothetical protein KC957_02820 [Candidatus Saccharibacteria bacterium]|nr:hypothetical protein [Candidatus Saccharibacteria bacterium]